MKSILQEDEAAGGGGMSIEKDRIIIGDAVEGLKTLPDGCVDMCVTSPPYYGLRDYGTGTWEGGDPNCPHRRMSKCSDKTITGHAQKELAGNVGDAIYKSVCPLCGAVRVDRQIGLEDTPDDYIQRLVDVFREVKRILKDDGTLWVNIGDTYNGNKKGNTEVEKHAAIAGKQDFEKKLWAGAKNKDLIGIPWMLAFALRADGWYLRQDIIWHKPNPMPESVTDRCTKSHEYIFLLSKSDRYYFDSEAIKEECVSGEKAIARAEEIKFGGSKYGDSDDPHYATKSGKGWKPQYKNLQENGQPNHSMHERRAEGLPDEQYAVRNKRDVWSVATKPYSGAHFATFPEELIKPCILAGSAIGGVVLDPFFGAGTTGVVAKKLERYYIGTELNPEYAELAENRIYYEADVGQIKIFEEVGA